VNYYIDDAGGYVNQEQIITHNVISTQYFDDDVATYVDSDDELPASSFVLGYNKEHDARYVGLEDVRLFEHNGETHFTANRGLPDGTMRIEYGTIDYENQTTKSVILAGPRNIEKNWVLYTDDENTLRLVYGWSPMTTYEIDRETGALTNKCEIMTPRFFELLRGSTNGVKVDDETWFICHLVSYEDRRYYYHILVAIDNRTGQLTRWSRLFTLEREKVEYVLGFVRKNDTEFLLGYSKMDRTSEFKVIEKKELEELFM
jgi:hypothetical protein